MGQPVPLASIHAAVLEFLRGQDDAVLFGAQAVNAYVDEPRMTQNVDILSPSAAQLAGEIRAYLNKRFHIAVRVRSVREGLGYRIDQVQKPKHRHLVDIRPVRQLPPSQRILDVRVVVPEELIVSKVIAYQGRKGKPKSGTDWRDIAVLLLQFPQLKTKSGPVRQRLLAAGADADTLATWSDIIAQEITAEEDEDEF